jgi:hypothetical protein
MTTIEQIQMAQQAKLVHADGKPVTLKLCPALAPDRIDDLEEQVGQPLPEELRSLLAFCSGFDECFGGIDFDFTGEGMFFGFERGFPAGLPIAADGCGNFWVLDITPQTRVTAPVFFACHDAPVILYQSADVASFLSEVFRMYAPPHKSLVVDVQDDKLFDVWRRNPGVIDHATASSSLDSSLRSFAATLGEEFQIVDLRRVDPGMGFSWGRYGPRTDVRRHGYERIFAYARPPRTGFLAKLFGR